MNKSKFEFYNEYFDVVSQKCNPKTLQGTLGVDDTMYFQGYEHHLLENGLHVYKKEEGMVITTEDITGYAVLPGQKVHSAEHTADVSMFRSEDGNKCGVRIPGGLIEYGTDKCYCALRTELERVDDNSKKGYVYRPTNKSDMFNKTYKGNIPSINAILDQATYQTNANKTVKEMFKQVIELDESVWSLVREKKITLEDAVRNAMAKGISIKDLTDEELIARYLEEQGKENKEVSKDD